MQYSKTSLIVTGATGFIGQKFVCLLDTNVKVKVLSRKKQFNYETIVCDLEKDIIPKNALDNIDTVFHLAGFSHDLRDAGKIVDLYYKVNVDATVQLAELAVKAGVKGLYL